MIEDRSNLVSIMLFVIGIGTVLPFNLLINSSKYFATKLDYEDAPDQIKKLSSFMITYLGLAATFPNLFLQGLNVFFGGSTQSIKKRLLISCVFQIIFLSLFIGCSFIDGKQKPYMFFTVVIFLTLLLNSASGVFQNLAFALAANLPMSYTNVVVTGSNFGGVFAAISSIISMLMSSNDKYSSFIFFLISIIYMIISIFTIRALYKNEYYIENSKFEEKPVLDNEVINKKTLEHFKIVFKQCWIHCLSVFLVFYVSLALFPAVCVKVLSVNNLNINYFLAFVTFLNFNLFAMIGNAITFWNKFPLIHEDKVYIYVLLRFLFLPFFLYFCNYQPFSTENRSMPIFLKSDVVFGIGVSFLGFTSGYLSSLCMMYAPKSVNSKEYAETAASLASFSIVLGCFLGISSFFVSYLV